MEVRPIFSALLRNKAGLALIVLQVAIALAAICNSLYIVVQRAERVGRPSGIDEANSFIISSLGFTPSFDTRGAMLQDTAAIAAIPGVLAVTPTNTVPTSNGGWSTGLDIQPLDPNGERRSQSSALYFVDEHGVEAFGVNLLAGRNFRPEEITDFTPDSGIQARVVIVTQALADKLYPEGDALGKPIYGLVGANETSTIIGIMEKMQQPWPTSRSVEQSSLVPARLVGGSNATYLVRSEPGRRDEVIKAVEAKLAAINGQRLLRNVRTVEEIRARSYQRDQAMIRILVAVMAAMVLITAAGIVGLASFWVTRRIKQIGTRRALGARRFNIRGYFQTENGIIVTLGVALGAVLTYGFNIWLMQNYGAERLPWHYLAAGAVTVYALGQLAVLGPAQKASQVSPAVATRTA